MSVNKILEEGIQLLKAQQFEQSVFLFTKGIEKYNDARLYSERGVAYFHLKKFDKSLSDMNKAVELEPKNAYRYSSRAYIKSVAGDVKGGILDYEMAIQLNPDDAIAFNNLGLLQEKLGYEKDSKASFNKADTISKNNPDFANLYYANATNTHGNSKVLNTSENPKIDWTTTKNEKKENNSFWIIIKNVFSSKETFKEFLNFIKSGFKINEK